MESAPPRPKKPSTSSSKNSSSTRAQLPFVALAVTKPTQDTPVGLGMKEVSGVGVVFTRSNPSSLLGQRYRSSIESLSGARVCQINGQRVTDSAHHAAGLIAAAPAGIVTLLLQQKSGSGSNTTLPADNNLVTASIHWSVGDRPLGIQLRQLWSGSVYVSHLEATSPFNATSLQPGMHLVTINNRRVKDCAQAMRMLRNTGIVTVVAESTVMAVPVAQPVNAANAISLDQNIPTVHDVTVVPLSSTSAAGTPVAVVAATALPLTQPTAPTEQDLW